MIRVQVSSNQVTDNLCFAKGVNGEMSKHTSKQTGNIGTTVMYGSAGLCVLSYLGLPRGIVSHIIV